MGTFGEAELMRLKPPRPDGSLRTFLPQKVSRAFTIATIGEAGFPTDEP